MDKKMLTVIGVIVALLAVIGVVVAVNMNDDKKTDDSNSTTSTTSDTSSVDAAKEFAPQQLDKLAYVATAKTTVSGQTVESTTESDGKGTTKTSSSYAGTATESYIKGNDVVTCISGQCTKTTVDPNSEEAKSMTGDLSSYKDSAKHSGTQACGSETCQVWKANGSMGEVTYLIDGKNRIAKIVMSSSETTYDYKDVTITIPTV